VSPSKQSLAADDAAYCRFFIDSGRLDVSWTAFARIFHAFEMFMGKASGAPLYFCYRKPLITQPMDISDAPAG